ncbi:DUF3124 domain-containing protein [Arenibacter sp. GZD96]|uniref:DUF3124 domain-containing protein n=1 Tax=Aurantibrevibacter litoralis TaxID=3106030 RepID=UPI002AFE4997|nr:DUF3124 domain-containing protein [Arenibacter sp. GZD-96]MEA1786303.1 DUF3124 domain-containing protein [Arenibacter sp. GZD-96]
MVTLKIKIIKIGILSFVIGLCSFSCDQRSELSSVNAVNWKQRAKALPHSDSLSLGTTYLSVYSQIYSATEHRTQDLTATISMRNTSLKDSLYVVNARYYNTQGLLIRIYFDEPIFLEPMETVAIVIDELDKQGGTGANFVFDWGIKTNAPEPLFEAVMISTSGQQGLSFTTQGQRIQ